MTLSQALLTSGFAKPPTSDTPQQVRRPSIPSPAGGDAAVNGGAFGTTSREATRRRLRHDPPSQHAVGPLQQRASAANSDDGRRVVDVGSIRRYHPSLPRMKTQVLSKKRKTRSRDVNAAANMERAMLA
ncbi:hypothetical protein P3T76_003754 [Phytophthora citrophthora]|uniref:Uncharacterized protein n=1 Tax=Phytophthora citrophthora TaxID=4793 RepID=A0AAD9GV96_9STRA|nr:hypothetical protein P3T76_003754 [Phytophthora citrophthora]